MKPSTAESIRNQNTFTDGNILSKWLDHETYAVCSYGQHWILALWKVGCGWYLNSTSYLKPTTNRHQRYVDNVLLGYPRLKQSDLQCLIRSIGAKPTPSEPAQFTPPNLTDKQQNLFDVST